MHSLKPDCQRGLQRKGGEACLRGRRGHFLQCGLQARFSELRPFRAILRDRSQGSLQLRLRGGAERIRTLRSEACKSRRLRKLREIKSFKNSLRLPASRGVVANQWGFRRSSKANPWRFCGSNWSLRSSESAWLGWRVTACLVGSHEIETFSGEKSLLEAGILADHLDILGCVVIQVTSRS
jgi:hypothetical protein